MEQKKIDVYHQNDQERLAWVETIFEEEDNSPSWSLESLERVIDILGVIKLVSDKFLDALGTAENYEIGYFPSDSVAGGFSHEKVFTVHKSGFAFKPVYSFFGKLRKVLDQFDLDVHDGHFVLNGIIERLENECAARYRLVNGVAKQEQGQGMEGFIDALGKGCVDPDTGQDRVVGKDGKPFSPVFLAYPSEVSDALAELESLAKSFIIQRTKAEIATLDLVDQKFEIERRIDADCSNHTRVKEALRVLLADLDKEMSWETQRKEIRESILADGLDRNANLALDLAGNIASGDGRQPNGERKLTIDRAMLLIYALGGSRLKGLDQKKMSHLIAYLIENRGGADTIEKRFSEVFPSAKPEAEGKIKKAGKGAWEKDIETVCYYLDFVGLSDESKKLREKSLNY